MRGNNEQKRRKGKKYFALPANRPENALQKGGPMAHPSVLRKKESVSAKKRKKKGFKRQNKECRHGRKTNQPVKNTTKRGGAIQKRWGDRYLQVA